MHSIKIVRQLIKEAKPWTQNRIASKLGLSSQAMSHRMNASDLKAGFLAEVLDILGYELVVVPAESKLPKNSIVVTGGEGKEG